MEDDRDQIRPGGRFAPFLPPRVRVRCPRRWLAWALGAVCLAGALGCGRALAGSTESLLPNVEFATAGGQQLWADVAWDDGWRVQRHVWTGHARLLDDDDVRRAWGGEEACVARLAARRTEGDAAAPAERVVVLLHGLWRTRDSMAPLAGAFGDAGYDVIDVAYPSARRTIDEHAAQVAALLDRLPGADREVSFVTHSLGALVVRELFAREGDEWLTRHRAHRAVFVAAPNQGSAAARIARRIPVALLVYGAPARELAGGAPIAPAPPIPFATVAAARGHAHGWNPLLAGDDDGIVTVAETRLDGAAEVRIVPGVHTFVMADPEVVAAAIRFVNAGRGEVRGPGVVR